ncbi:MAG: respiratory nitrate reductase subunit gamma [Acidobacteriota bacterium]
MTYLNVFLFAVFPYLALVVLLVISILRYVRQGFTYSSLSSQFLENRYHFWGSVPFHYGIIVVLLGHLVAFLMPRQILWWNSTSLRLYILEVSALICGLLALVGLVNLVLRRLTHARARVTTSAADWIVFGLLMFSIATGVYIAIAYKWGSSWFAASLSPYLWSIVTFSPRIEYVIGLPVVVQLHILAAFTLLLLFPFTRLVHILVVPIPYLWRRPQVVRWYWNRRLIRNALTGPPSP